VLNKKYGSFSGIPSLSIAVSQKITAAFTGDLMGYMHGV
jgi:hypothetical protein